MSPQVIAIVQARMGSARLPGKTLANLAGKPLLWHVLDRLQQSTCLNAIVLATTSLTEDDVLEPVAAGLGIPTFRGAKDDLVDRFLRAGQAHKADVVVRVCADNPVVEAEEVDRIIRYHARGESDFSSNLYQIQNSGYPDGIGAEVFDFARLEELSRLTSDSRHREHIHTFFYEHPEKYRIGTIPCPSQFRRPDLKLDVNTAEELHFMQAIYEYWYPRKPRFHITDIIRWYDTVYATRDAGGGRR